MEAVIATGLAVCLLVPQLQSVGQGLALVGAGVVDDSGGAAAKGSQGAAGKIIYGGRAGHVQIKVGVGVDKPGQDQLTGHVDNAGAGGGGDGPGHLYDRFSVDQHVGLLGALAGHHGPAAKQSLHDNRLPVNISYHFVL